MEKIGKILEKFGVKKYAATSEDQLLELFKEKIERSRNNDLLNELIFPGSPLLTILDPSDNSTILHLACSYYREKEIVEKLISCGANINAQNASGCTPLHVAMEEVHFFFIESYDTYVSRAKFKKRVEIMKVLIKNKASIHICNDEDQSALHKALLRANWEILEILLENYKIPNIDKRGGRNYPQIEKKERCRHLIKYLVNESEKCIIPSSNFSALLEFIVLQDEELDDLFEYTVKNTIFNVNAQHNYRTLLHIAALRGTPAMIDALIAAGADVNIYNELCAKQTPIFVSIIEYKHKNLKSFLDNGACVDMVELREKRQEFENVETNTPLHYAVCSGDFKMTKMLVEKGANVNALSYHRSPLLMACGSIHSDKWKLSHPSSLVFSSREELVDDEIPPCVNALKIVELLLDNGADIEAKNPRKRTALDQSCKFGNLDNVNLLLSRGAKIKKRGFTTLHYAITGSNPDIVKTIVQKGVNVNYVCTRKGTPLQYAIKEINVNCEEIIKILLTYNADVNLTGKRMMSPLHLACLSDETDVKIIQMSQSKATIIKELLNSNANINACDKKGRTPLYYARYNYILMRIAGSRNDSGNPYKPDLEVLVAFIIEMRARKKYISEQNLRLLEDKEISHIYDKYQNEINFMKEKIISSLNISYLDMFSKDIYYLGGVLKNNGVIEVLNSAECKEKFPLYGSKLEDRIQEGQHLRSLTDLAVNFFSKCMQLNFPSELIVQIVRLMSRKDLETFTKQCLELD